MTEQPQILALPDGRFFSRAVGLLPHCAGVSAGHPECTAPDVCSDVFRLDTRLGILEAESP